jgi:prepilin-type N-terminal cleavage/methylation domain-containing protein
MIRVGQKGLTLIELLIAIAIFGLIAAGAAALLSASLDANTQGNSRYGLYREGLMIMEHMTGEVRRCTFLLIPNAHNTTRDILAISGFYNDDDDNYFDDTLFPRIDEDPGNDTSGDGEPGIALMDDDGDGSTDEGGQSDNDDEDGATNEDPWDGKDNDGSGGDGNVDEDPPEDANNDGAPGIKGMDDDGDDSVDEGATDDDDEDGRSSSEDPLNPILYTFNSGTNTLKKSVPHIGQTVDLSTRVSAFQATWETPDRILITLTLTGDDGEGVTFSEYVHIENTYQRIGKRVK